MIVLPLSGPLAVDFMEREWKGQICRGGRDLPVEWNPGVSRGILGSERTAVRPP